MPVMHFLDTRLGKGTANCFFEAHYRQLICKSGRTQQVVVLGIGSALLGAATSLGTRLVASGSERRN